MATQFSLVGVAYAFNVTRTSEAVSHIRTKGRLNRVDIPCLGRKRKYAFTIRVGGTRMCC